MASTSVADKWQKATGWGERQTGGICGPNRSHVWQITKLLIGGKR